jgi:glycosyltransferase involved in cell wall biosynthesis
LTNKKKIAIVANSTWNIHNFRLNILTVLSQYNYDITVIAPTDQYITYKKLFPQVKHINLKKLVRKGTNPLKDWQLTLELLNIYRAEKPDIILHYTIKPNIFGGIAAQIAKIPYICVVTGLGYSFLHEGFINFISKKLYRYSFNKSEKVIFENIDDRLLFNQLGLVGPEKSISVKGCGINIDHFKPFSANGFAKHIPVVFSFIGRLLYDKGVKEFVEAARIVKKSNPDTQFWVIGDIDKDNPSALNPHELQSWIEEGIIEYHGHTEDIKTYISKTDCVVCPSYREAIPRVVQEGMAMKKSIITTDTAGCKEAVEEGKNGYLVPIKNVPILAQAMIKITQLDAQQLRDMGEYSRKKVENEFDEKIIANQFIQIIEQAI